MRTVILGGGGFIGSHLCEALLLDGNEVVVFDQQQAQYLNALQNIGATILMGDFSNLDDITNAITKCDVIYHLVSTTVPQTSNENPVYDVKTNIIGTIQLLEIARQVNVKKIVYISSGGTVYGIPQEIPIKENHPTEPICSYGICKLMVEKYLHLFWTLYKLDYCILRVANAYGERQPTTGSQGVIGAFLDKAIHNSDIVIWGNGSVLRDYIYIKDIVDALVKAGSYEGEPRIFNIGGGQGHSLNDILDIIEDIIHQPLKPKYLPGRHFDVPVNVLDITLAKKYLNWQPAIGLHDGIARTYYWMIKK